MNEEEREVSVIFIVLFEANFKQNDVTRATQSYDKLGTIFKCAHL